MSETVVTRIAPSPTGPFHIGTARTALFNYLYAKKHAGTFILRFEDTDVARSKKEYLDDAHSALKWLGMHPDVVVRQSDRTDLYHERISQLIQDGKAYISHEQARDSETDMVDVVRFKNPQKKVSFHDDVRGVITMETSELGDFVIAKSVRKPLYNLAVVIDDIAMGVTHIIRGDDHISNTPRQILLFEAFGKQAPRFVHIPLIHSADGGKLSKRKHATAVNAFRDEGYLPEALINYMASLGWSSKEDTELYSKEELIERFSFEKLQKKEAVYDEAKLRWYNQHYLRTVSERKLLQWLLPVLRKRLSFFLLLRRSTSTAMLLQELRQRCSTVSDMQQAIRAGEYDFYYKSPECDATLLLPSPETKKDVTCMHLDAVKKLLAGLSSWKSESIQEALLPYAETHGKKDVLWPLRVALSGKKQSPDIFSIVMAIGKRETHKRIMNAIACLQNA